MRASLNAVSSHVLILNRTGKIIASNLAWQRFAASQRGSAGARRGENYLALFNVQLDRCPQAPLIKAGVASVLAGRLKTMRGRFSWRDATGIRWFDLKASRLGDAREVYVMAIAEDVTAAKQAEQALGEAAETLLTLQQQERQRIAQEIHDSTVQHVVAAGLNLMGLRSKMEPRGETLEFLERIESSLDEASKELRSLTYLLHPPSLESQGLVTALRRYADGFSKRTGLSIRVRAGQGADQVPMVLRRALFRVVQEGLANVHRHACASRVSIDMRRILERLHLVIRDNGLGVECGSRPMLKAIEPVCPGVGIPGIRARLHQFGGKLVIKSGVHGTMLHAAVPVGAALASDDAVPWTGISS